MKKHQLQRPFDPTRNPNARTRRIGSPAFGRIRLRRNAAVSGVGRRVVGPTTPLLTWKIDDCAGTDADSFSEVEPESDRGSICSSSRRRRNKRGKERDGVVSARKIAAGIWHVNAGLGFEPNVVDPHCFTPNTSKNKHMRPSLLNYPKNGFLDKFDSSTALPYPSMEKATKWDNEVYSHSKPHELSSLQYELDSARARITELEIERRAFKKKCDHVIKKVEEEKDSWRRREQEKIQSIIHSIKEDLTLERKTRKRLEAANSKLVSELEEVKKSAKRFLQSYEKERKNRMLMEEVCDELAKEISEDKAEFEGIKEESMRIKEEVQEEKEMLQMAEVWREERVQMKLVDAKVTLEEKYSQLSRLQAEIESFLKSRGDSNLNEEEKREAELLKEAADSVMAQEVTEFSYQPPPVSEDIFAVFEELQADDSSKSRDIKTSVDKKETVNSSLTHDSNGDESEDDSGWETVSHPENRGSNSSMNQEKSNASDASESFSISTTQSKKKSSSSISRFFRSSHRNSFEMTNARMSNATLSSLNAKSLDLGLSSPSIGEWSSPDSVNSHSVRGRKSCMEWPRGVQKHSLKEKLLEARVGSQKIQLRQALKHKI